MFFTTPKRYAFFFEKLLCQILLAFVYGTLGAGFYAYYNAHSEKWELAALIKDLTNLGPTKIILNEIYYHEDTSGFITRDWSKAYVADAKLTITSEQIGKYIKPAFNSKNWVSSAGFWIPSNSEDPQLRTVINTVIACANRFPTSAYYDGAVFPYWKETQAFLNSEKKNTAVYILAAAVQFFPDGNIMPNSPLRDAQAFIYDDFRKKLFYVECNY
jgi:hypothetical protein